MASNPIGDIVPGPEAAPPSPTTLTGRTVTLVPLSPAHAIDLFPLVNNDHPDQTALWTYIPDGPYDRLEDLEKDFTARQSSSDPLFFAILDTAPTPLTPQSSGKAVGYVALMSISPSHRRLEIGHVIFSRPLQRTTGATEAIHLLLKHSIETLGYRRIEWKCNALNAGSRRAALRLGFQFEGVFRRHMVVKGRNRDTAWFSMLDEEWKPLREGFDRWLGEGNFDDHGRQRRGLEEIRREVIPN
ncbi:GNAT family N-acetyltransferase [Aspergillus lucknowensis]|uniref:Acyl-CoA N-acyltransferase n=1 Tax=Aspergillus lucknowensis TaxID=176173 RepID=A0ABR4M518_9EURO